MVEEWMEEIRKSVSPDMLGMMLVHNGVVRASSKQGTAVKGMRLTYDRRLLAAAIDEAKSHEGIADVKAWINEGDLGIGDDIMYVLVAGRFRTDVIAGSPGAPVEDQGGSCPRGGGPGLKKELESTCAVCDIPLRERICTNPDGKGSKGCPTVLKKGLVKSP